MLIDFGLQPPSNRFEQIDTQSNERHPLTIGQCSICGLVQLINPMAPVMVKPRFEWLSYNEPEGHLDDLVSHLCELPNLAKKSRIIGVTFKDDTLLGRFNRRGYTETYRYEPKTDLGLAERAVGLESIQATITPKRAVTLAEEYGSADLLIVRHILEHAHDPLAFLAALATLVRPNGYFLFEMPDSTKFINACDYSFLWEEHITYFCPETFVNLIGNAGLAVEEMIVYPYPLEDTLVGIVHNEGVSEINKASRDISSLSAPDSTAFARRFPEIQDLLQSRLNAWQSQGKRIAIFGAGHLAAKFINLYSLSDFIECIIDDHPNKKGLLMPGSRIPIRSSEVLEEMDICLLALNSESEQKVVAKHRSFLDRGGRFFSIFALGTNSIYDTGGA